jgi:hypothetical protein
MPYAATSPYYFFDRTNDAARERKLRRAEKDAPLQEQRLYCARCRHAITGADQRIIVNGAEEHDCVNPLGLRFRIVCFRQAPGCAVWEPGTLEHTWFAGYAWSIAGCARCRTHVGWCFHSKDDTFFGLIVDRLTSAS